MSYKNYRYRHEKICTDEPKPVKPQANPKGKSKPKAQPIVQDVEEEIIEEHEDSCSIREPKPKLTPPKGDERPKALSREVSNQILKPQTSNPLNDITNHDQLLQQQFIQQKKEKYHNLCQNMFASRSRR